MTTIWTATAEFACAEDAAAFRDLAAELGIRSEVHSRTLSHRSPIRETRLGRIVLRRAPTADRTFTLDDVRDWCTQEDYQPNSASPALSRLVIEGDLYKEGPGLYRRAK